MKGITIQKALDTIETQKDEISYLNKMIHTLKDVKDGDRERARHYLSLTLEASPIYQRVIDDIVDNDLTPSDMILKNLKLGIKKKERYEIIRDKFGIGREVY